MVNTGIQSIIARSQNSLGDAPEDFLLSIIQAAGWPIWPLIACSIAALALILERAVALRRPKIAPEGVVDEVIALTRQGLPTADVVDKLAASSLLGGVLASGLRCVSTEPRWNEAGLRQSLETAGSVAAHRLERNLNALATLATASPLLGLLGTVIGMIEIFGSQSSGGGTNPAELAHGISVALYNTALGLLVAIPSLMAHRYFRGRINDYLHDLEQAAERLAVHLVRSIKR